MPPAIGRPSTLTPAIHTTIVTAYESGLSFPAACRQAGIVPGTAWNWVQRGQGRREELPERACFADFAHAILRVRERRHSIPVVPAQPCRICGQLVKGGQRKYCSHRCAGLAQRKRLAVNCDTCGKAFEICVAQREQAQHFCSVDCYASPRQRIAVVCMQCQKPLLRKPSQIRSDRTFCSLRCWGDYLRNPLTAACGTCGVTITRKRSAMQSATVYCSWACYNRARPQNVTVWCLACGMLFEVWYSAWKEGKKYCSKACYAHGKRIYPDVQTARRAYNARRRARMAAAPFVEVVLQEVLYAREHGICQICMKRCKKEDASCDHIIPLSLGGETSYKNCVLAHLRCNVRKGARATYPQQLRLFG